MKKIVKIGAVALTALLLAGCSFGKSIDAKNEDVIRKISKETKSTVIDNLQLVDENILLTSIGLEAKDVKDYIGKIPMYNRPEGTLYIAIKPAKGSEDKVEDALDSYIDGLKSKINMEAKTTVVGAEEKKTDTSKKELEYLKNITKEKYKGYFIYVSGDKKDTIVKLLKERVK